MEKIKINFFLKKEILTAKEYINFCKKIILTLQDFDLIYNNVETWDDETNSAYKFDNELSNFNYSNLKRIINEDKELAYENADSNHKSLDINSKSWLGFSSTFSFGSDSSNKDILITIRHGTYDKNQNSSIKFEFNKQYQVNYVNKNYIVRLIESLEKILEIKFANAISNQFFLKLRIKSNYTIGWVNYLPNNNLINYFSSEDICYISKSGVIFSISDDVPKSDDKEIVAKAIQIRDLLNSLNLLSKNSSSLGDNKKLKIYKTYKGKTYTKEEWEKFEQEQFEEYARKNNIPIEKDSSKKGGRFFLDEKESDY